MREGARRMLTNAVRGVHLPVLVLGTAALVWEFLTWLFNVPRFLLPPPSAIFAGIFDNLSLLVFHSVYTLESTLMGFGLAVVLGVVLAVCIVQFKFLEKTLYTLLISLNSIPKVAIAPLFIVWMGTGLEPKVAIAAMIAIFAIVIDMVHGLRSVDPEMIDLGRALRGSGYKIMVKNSFSARATESLCRYEGRDFSCSYWRHCRRIRRGEARVGIHDHGGARPIRCRVDVWRLCNSRSAWHCVVFPRGSR